MVQTKRNSAKSADKSVKKTTAKKTTGVKKTTKSKSVGKKIAPSVLENVTPDITVITEKKMKNHLIHLITQTVSILMI